MSARSIIALARREAIEKVRFDFVVDELIGGDAEDLTPDTNLIALGVVDSLSMVALRHFVERTFRIRIPSGSESRSFASITALTEAVLNLHREGET